MRGLTSSALAITLMVSLSPSFAQVATPTHTHIRTIPKMYSEKKPYAHDIKRRMHDLYKRIKDAAASGKISKQTAKNLRFKVTAVSKQMGDNFKINKNNGATESQYKQLYKMLEDASKAIDDAIDSSKDVSTKDSKRLLTSPSSKK